MYSVLKLLLKKNKIKYVDLKQKLNCGCNTISEKINGKSEFSIEEAKVIQKEFFPEYTLEELFEKQSLKF